jgi:hypothetical protein
MKHWKLTNDFWTTMEKGLHGYTHHPPGGVINTPFPRTYDSKRNHLKLAFREHDMIGWDNLLKRWMGRQWTEYVKQHIHNEKIKLQAK